MRHLASLLSCCLVCQLVLVQLGVVRAQEGPANEVQVQKNAVMVQASQGPGGEMQVMSFSSNGEAPMMLSFQPGLPGSVGGVVDPFSLLSNPSVQNELDLVGSQLQQYLDLQKAYSTELQQLLSRMRDNNFSREDGLKLGDTIKDIEARKKQDIENLLLPTQRQRLQQISLQQRMQNAGAIAALNDEQIRKELGLSDDDVKRLRDKANELNKKLQKKIRDLQIEIRDELLEELTPEQRGKIKSMLGERFDMEATSWQLPKAPNKSQRDD